jgi:chemotaxis protein MotB
MNPRVPRSRVTHDRWLVSYADFITLLFGFFVVLYAFARADQKKQIQVSQAINSAFRSMGVLPVPARDPATSTTAGADPAGEPANAVMSEDMLTPAQVKDDLDRLRRELAQNLSSQVANHSISLEMGRDGLVISLREAGFFDSGSAVPKSDALPTLRQIAEKLGSTPYDLRIEGHTDNVPIHNAEFDSNWELSSARATRIARLFLDMKAIPPDRLSAAGYAEYHPVAGNGTPEGRAENRRVDLVVMPRAKIDFAAQGPAQESGAWREVTDNN